jgi:hypothetical protein
VGLEVAPVGLFGFDGPVCGRDALVKLVPFWFEPLKRQGSTELGVEKPAVGVFEFDQLLFLAGRRGVPRVRGDCCKTWAIRIRSPRRSPTESYESGDSSNQAFVDTGARNLRLVLKRRRPSS